MKKYLSLAVLFVSIAAFSEPSTFQDPFLNHLVGDWVLRGEIAHKQTTHDVTGEWVLGHQYLRLHEISREKNSKGQPVYEALVFIGWDETSGQYACLWLDTTGTSGFPAEGVGRAKRGGNDIPFVFRDAKGQPNFRNIFTYDPQEDCWAWRLDNVSDGKEIPFARLKLGKK